jgi:hypothetical protein
MIKIFCMASRHYSATAWSSQTFVPVGRFSSRRFLSSTKGFGENNSPSKQATGVTFSPGDKIQVEILSFGPLGASVDVVATSHLEDDMIPIDAPPLGSGLILQREIEYFRQGRGNVDVVRGEVLPAYVERIRETGKIDVTLRAYGGEAKADILGKQIMDLLKERKTLPIGDKSDPRDIERYFPGVSKKSFKRALSGLYKQRLVLVDKFSVPIVEN